LRKVMAEHVRQVAQLRHGFASGEGFFKRVSGNRNSVQRPVKKEKRRRGQHQGEATSKGTTVIISRKASEREVSAKSVVT